MLTIISMAFLTYLGASAGSPTEIEGEVAAEYESGRDVAAQSGCLACHKFGENGNDGPGPELTEIGATASTSGDRARRSSIRPGIMPPYADLPEEKFDALVDYLASLQGE